ncbi:MAG: hypothetical protein MZU84_08370 [Sphingobacterium sp.]|nr:hypothetical protein [Sphingobacterium sp.]
MNAHDQDFKPGVDDFDPGGRLDPSEIRHGNIEDGHLRRLVGIRPAGRGDGSRRTPRRPPRGQIPSRRDRFMRGRKWASSSAKAMR